LEAELNDARLLVARPLLPPAEAVLPYLRRIDASRWYTNGGELLREFEIRLAAHFSPPGQAGGHVGVFSSATTGLTLALMAATNGRRGQCLMPSWTFGATACAVLAAGLTPRFLDVEPDSWMLDRAQMHAALREGDGHIVASLLVPPAGIRMDIGPWQELAARHGVPLIVDAADCFDTVVAQEVPQVVSLHACKTFGIGEGGCVVARDAAFIARLRQLANFGIGADRIADVPGINGKLSEYGVAVGLAALDCWPKTRGHWRQRAETYRRILAAHGFTLLWHRDAACATALIDLGAPVAAAAAVALRSAGMEGRRWWGDGCHAQPAFANLPRAPLPATEALAARILGLPLHVDMDEEQMARVAAQLKQALAGMSSPGA